MTNKTTVPTPEGLQLLAEHIGVDLDTLQQAAQDKREAQRIARLEAQLLAEREAEARKLDRARKALHEAWQAGHIIVRVDGKVLPKPKDICTSGDPNMDGVIRHAIDMRRKLLREFKSIDPNGKFQKAASIRRSVSCTCGKDHFVEVFITGYSTK